MKLLNMVDNDQVIKTDQIVRHTINGVTKEYPIYKVDIDLLFYNDLNDRVATWISKYEMDNPGKKLADLNNKDRNNIIEQFVIDSNPESIKKTKDNIKAVHQRIPAVVLNDGRVIDGNRRFTCLRLLRKETPYPEELEYRYIETAIMDLDINADRKMIKILELNLQHATDEKVDYDLIDYAIGTYQAVEVDKILKASEYAIQAGESGAKVTERIEIAKLMNDYLELVGLPKQYYHLRKNQSYSLFQEFLKSYRKCATEEEKNTLKNTVFVNYMLGSFVDVKVYLRDLSKIMGTNYLKDMLKKEEGTVKKVCNELCRARIQTESDLNHFIHEHTTERNELKNVSDATYLAYKKGAIKASPIASVESSLRNLDEIDSRIFASLNTNDLAKLNDSLEKLQKRVNRLINDVIDTKS